MPALRLFLVLLCTAIGFGAAIAGTPLEPVQDKDLAEGWRAYSAADYERARTFYRKAAERDHTLAQFNLAVMLIEGQGGVADTAEGLRWLRKAADGGLARAQY